MDCRSKEKTLATTIRTENPGKNTQALLSSAAKNLTNPIIPNHSAAGGSASAYSAQQVQSGECRKLAAWRSCSSAMILNSLSCLKKNTEVLV
jgi:hypothetical protein